MANGGKREGAGRPVVPDEEKRKPLTIYLPEAAQQNLHAQAAMLGMSPGEWVELWLTTNPLKADR